MSLADVEPFAAWALDGAPECEERHVELTAAVWAGVGHCVSSRSFESGRRMRIERAFSYPAPAFATFRLKDSTSHSSR